LGRLVRPAEIASQCRCNCGCDDKINLAKCEVEIDVDPAPVPGLTEPGGLVTIRMSKMESTGSVYHFKKSGGDTYTFCKDPDKPDCDPKLTRTDHFWILEVDGTTYRFHRENNQIDSSTLANSDHTQFVYGGASIASASNLASSDLIQQCIHTKTRDGIEFTDTQYYQYYTSGPSESSPKSNLNTTSPIFPTAAPLATSNGSPKLSDATVSGNHLANGPSIESRTLKSAILTPPPTSNSQPSHLLFTSTTAREESPNWPANLRNLRERSPTQSTRTQTTSTTSTTIGR